MPRLDEGEVMALVVHWLSSGPCRDAAAALAAEAERQGLLPQRLDIQGAYHPDLSVIQGADTAVQPVDA
jgi:hypothetical protein